MKKFIMEYTKIFGICFAVGMIVGTLWQCIIIKPWEDWYIFKKKIK